MNKSIIVGACVIAVGLALNGFLAGGRYSLTQLSQDDFVRLDRWTGNVQHCIVADEGYMDSLLNCEWDWTYSEPVQKKKISN